jgi:hypothetical protein
MSSKGNPTSSAVSVSPGFGTIIWLKPTDRTKRSFSVDPGGETCEAYRRTWPRTALICQLLDNTEAVAQNSERIHAESFARDDEAGQERLTRYRVKTLIRQALHHHYLTTVQQPKRK